MVLAGDGPHLYDPAVLLRYQQVALGSLYPVNRPMAFVNPPPLALLLALPALLPREAAFLLWTGCQVVLLVWTLRLTTVAAADWSTSERRLALAAVVALPMVLITFLLGTFSLLLLVCLWQTALALRRGDEGGAGRWLLVGLLVKPQLWLALLVMLAGARRRRALAHLLVGGLGIGLVTSWLFGPAIWPDWLIQVGRLNDRSDDASRMPTLRGVMTVLLGGAPPLVIDLVSWAALALVLAGVAWLWRRGWGQPDADWTARLGLTTIAGLFFSPHLNPHDLLLLVVPAVLAYDLQRRLGDGAAFSALLAAAPLLLLASDLGLSARLGLQLSVVLTLVLAVWLLRLQRAPRALTRPSEESRS
jgi:hypothetical protein